MKRFISFFCIIALLGTLCVFSASAAATPIAVNSPDDLYMLISENPDGHFVLTADLKPIAVMGMIPEFRGTLDGQGYSINGCCVYTENNITALIAVNKGTVKNLNIRVNMSAQTDADGVFVAAAYTAGIAGKNYGTIENCSVTGILEAPVSGENFQNFVGGIAAYNGATGIIKNCFSRAQITASNDSVTFICAGGIVGQNEDGTVDKCVSIPQLDVRSEVVNNDLRVGSVVGHNWYGHVTDVYSHFTLGDLIGKQQVSHSTDTFTALDSLGIMTQSSYAALDFNKLWKMGSSSAELTHNFSCNHVWDDYVFVNKDTHTRICTLCLHQEALQSHIFVSGKCACGYTAPKQVTFSDVGKKDYFYTAVNWAVENEVTAGVSATKFGPAQSCTRAQVVTFLWRAAGCPDAGATLVPFSDIKSKDYYYQAVLWAVKNGITAGATATTFAPSAPCTRAQVVSFLHRFAGTPKPDASRNPFGDVKTKDYYYKAVLWAVENNITAGSTPKTFAPDEICTRAQVVSFLYRHMV